LEFANNMEFIGTLCQLTSISQYFYTKDWEIKSFFRIHLAIILSEI
jgi:hypothetical protein